MIRFTCPTCKKLLQAALHQGGIKMACPGCGQRLQVPGPPRDKTVLGDLVPEEAVAPAAQPQSRSPWFYTQGQQRVGPVSWQQLQQLAASRVLDPKTLVWTEGMTGWTPASSVKELYPARTAGKPVEEKAIAGRVRAAQGSRAWKWAGVSLGAACVGLLVILTFVLGGRSGPTAQGAQVASVDPTPPQPPQLALPKELTSKEIAARFEKSVALIKNKLAHGTGFVVAPGIVATNAHVVAKGTREQLTVEFPSAAAPANQPMPVEAILHVDHKRDLALLRVKTDLPPLEVATRFKFQRGQGVTTIGNPGLLDGTILKNNLTSGVVSSELTHSGVTSFMLNMSINGGNSGGPVFDSTGQVIGVIKATAREKEGIAFCVTCLDLQAALTKVEKQTPQDVARTTSFHNLEAVKKQLIFLGVEYGQVMDKSVQLLIRAAQNGHDLNGTLLAFRRALDKPLKIFDEVMTDLQAALNRFAADPNLTRADFQGTTDLWNKCTEMKNFIMGKEGGDTTLKAYEARKDELIRQFLALVQALPKPKA